jgi:ferredoxin
MGDRRPFLKRQQSAALVSDSFHPGQQQLCAGFLQVLSTRDPEKSLSARPELLFLPRRLRRVPAWRPAGRDQQPKPADILLCPWLSDSDRESAGARCLRLGLSVRPGSGLAAPDSDAEMVPGTPAPTACGAEKTENYTAGASGRAAAFSADFGGAVWRTCVLRVYLPLRHAAGRCPAALCQCPAADSGRLAICLERTAPAACSQSGHTGFPAVLPLCLPSGGDLWLFQPDQPLPGSRCSSACTHCGACARQCPMAVPVPDMPDSAECIRCGECAAVCPTEAIRVGFGAGQMEKAKGSKSKAAS